MTIPEGARLIDATGSVVRVRHEPICTAHGFAADPDDDLTGGVDPVWRPRGSSSCRRRRWRRCARPRSPGRTPRTPCGVTTLSPRSTRSTIRALPSAGRSMVHRRSGHGKRVVVQDHPQLAGLAFALHAGRSWTRMTLRLIGDWRRHCRFQTAAALSRRPPRRADRGGGSPRLSQHRPLRRAVDPELRAARRARPCPACRAPSSSAARRVCRGAADGAAHRVPRAGEQRATFAACWPKAPAARGAVGGVHRMVRRYAPITPPRGDRAGRVRHGRGGAPPGLPAAVRARGGSWRCAIVPAGSTPRRTLGGRRPAATPRSARRWWSTPPAPGATRSRRSPGSLRSAAPCRRTAAIIDPAPLDVALADAGRCRAHWYARPEARTRLLVSPADETPMHAHDVQPDEFDIAIAIDRMQQALDIAVQRIERSWAGLRTFTPDGSLAFGWDATAEGFFWCVGQGGYGIQTSPAAGKLVADLVAGRDPGERGSWRRWTRGGSASPERRQRPAVTPASERLMNVRVGSAICSSSTLPSPPLRRATASMARLLGPARHGRPCAALCRPSPAARHAEGLDRTAGLRCDLRTPQHRGQMSPNDHTSRQPAVTSPLCPSPLPMR